MEKWLKEIQNEAFNIFHHLNLFKELGRIIDSNQKFKKMDNTLFGWMRRAFTVDLIIGIGRLCDDNKNTKSLVRFLRALKKDEIYLNRKKYVSLYEEKHPNETTLDKYMRERAHADFDRLAGKGAKSYPKSAIENDISKLLKQEPCQKILGFRNEYIAHLGKIKRTKIPTYTELYQAFEIIETIIKKYVLLIFAANLSSTTPTPQGNWEEVLTIPWIERKRNGMGIPIA